MDKLVLRAEEKSWSNQRAKRRRKLQECEQREAQNETESETNEKIMLEFEFRLKLIDQVYNVELSLTRANQDSGSDRESLNQILQYLKNQIPKLESEKKLN